MLSAQRAVAVVAGAVLLVAGLVGLLALVSGDDERPESAVVTTTVAPPLTTSSATTGPGTTGPGTSGPATTSSATTTGPDTTGPGTAGQVTTTPPTTGADPTPTVPGATVPGAPAPPGAPPTVAPGQVAPTPEAQQAVALAQQLGDALASGQWDAARALNPGRNESDAFLQQAYGTLVKTTVVPASVVETSTGRFDLLLGLVAHEQQATGPQSVLMCAHWMVDVPTNTVTRVSFSRLRVEPGFVDPATRADELRAACGREK